MSYLTVFCVVTAEALTLVLSHGALRRTMPRVLRPLVAGAGVSCAWGAWILVLVLRGPLWMMALTGAGFALSSAAMGYAIHLATVEVEKPQGEGGGGPGPPASPDRPRGGGTDEPSWWPEFEREMAAYAAQHDREPQPIDF